VRHQGDFTEVDFGHALERMPAASSVAQLLFAGVDLAVRELADRGELGFAVYEGVGAFVSGVLLAVTLRDCGLSELDGLWISRGADTIKRRGRHAVIADQCDLQAVASVEQTFAGELSERHPAHVAALRPAFVRLFETGLALGLVG
jgi:hypothetical protein